MKNLIKTGLFTVMLTLPVYAYAQETAMPQKDMTVMCPMAGDMAALQKDMGRMMGEMGGMMDMMSDPAMKERMQAMHDAHTTTGRFAWRKE